MLSPNLARGELSSRLLMILVISLTTLVSYRTGVDRMFYISLNTAPRNVRNVRIIVFPLENMYRM